MAAAAEAEARLDPSVSSSRFHSVERRTLLPPQVAPPHSRESSEEQASMPPEVSVP